MRYVVILFCALFLGACAKETTGISIDSSTQNVVLTNADMGKALVFGNARTSIVNERLLAQVRVTNKDTDTKNLQYRFNWYNEQGLEVDNGRSPWRQFVINGGDSVTLQGVALDPNATDFRVSIREIQ